MRQDRTMTLKVFGLKRTVVYIAGPLFLLKLQTSPQETVLPGTATLSGFRLMSLFLSPYTCPSPIFWDLGPPSKIESIWSFPSFPDIRQGLVAGKKKTEPL
jgi:hypothetical protein